VFPLKCSSNAKLPEQTTATTITVEAHNGVPKRLNFGQQEVIDTIARVDREKHLKYYHLVADAAAIQTVIDFITYPVRELQADGYAVRREDLAQLSPFQTRRLKHSGDYTLSMSSPEPLEPDLVVPLPFARQERARGRRLRRDSPSLPYLGIPPDQLLNTALKREIRPQQAEAKRQRHFIQEQLVAAPRMAPTKLAWQQWAESAAPQSDRLVADLDATFGEHSSTSRWLREKRWYSHTA